MTLDKLAVSLVGEMVEDDLGIVERVVVEIDSYYSFEVFTADGSFRVFDSFVRAGLPYDGHLPPNRVKMRHEVLVDLSAMTPYGVLTFSGMAFSILGSEVLKYPYFFCKKIRIGAIEIWVIKISFPLFIESIIGG